jgi:hypothetical protein
VGRLAGPIPDFNTASLFFRRIRIGGIAVGAYSNRESRAAWAQVIARQFEPLFPKLGVLAKEAVPISILNLRSAVKSAQAERLEKELTLLLINRLSREKEIFRAGTAAARAAGIREGIERHGGFAFLERELFL